MKKKSRKMLKFFIILTITIFVLTLFTTGVLYLSPPQDTESNNNQEETIQDELPDILRQLDSTPLNNNAESITGETNSGNNSEINIGTGTIGIQNNNTGNILTGN